MTMSSPMHGQRGWMDAGMDPGGCVAGVQCVSPAGAGCERRACVSPQPPYA